MNNTPITPPANPPVEPQLDSLHTSFLKSLQLTVTPPTPNPQPVTGAPVPDTGVEVPSTIADFSEGDGLSERIAKLNKDNPVEAVKPAEPTPPVVPPVAPVEPAKPVEPVAAPVPAPAPAEPLPKIKIPEMPKPISDDPVLPPPPSTLSLDGLDEDDIEEVRTAEFAENKYPQLYAGHAKRVLEFIRKHKQFVSQQEQEDPNVSFDSNNTQYQKFLQANRPTISGAERKRLERERLIEEAVQQAEKKMSSKTKKLEDEVVQLKAAPLVERTINDYKSLVKELMPKEDDPIVAEAAAHMSAKAVEAGREFMLISAGLKAYDPRSETHKWLADFIQEQGDLYVKSGHTSLKRGQRTFVPRAKFNSLPPDDRAKHFTFTDEDVLQLVAVNAKAAAEYHAKNEKDRLEKAGYRRTPAPVSPQPVPVAPTPEPSARATPTVSGNGPIGDNQPTDPFLRFLRGK